MNRKEYYAERSKLRSMRSMVFSGWINKNTKDNHAHEVLYWIERNFNSCVVHSVDRNQWYMLRLCDYKQRSTAWANSRGTRPVNVKKAGRK